MKAALYVSPSGTFLKRANSFYTSTSYFHRMLPIQIITINCLFLQNTLFNIRA